MESIKNKLKVEYVPIESVKPYERNARRHEDADVDMIANSIREFGFNDAVGVWGNDNIIVEGHGRVLAAKKLGMDTIPVIHLNHLTDEQRRAYTLAHNKTAENSAWDFELLDLELGDIELDMEPFGFDVGEEESVLDESDDDGGYYGDEREKTYNAVNLNEYDESRTAGFYQMPVIKACNYAPDDLVGFNYVKTAKEYDCGVHFFLDDYQFERIWNAPHEMIERLKPFQCCLTPDFSLYMDMPMSMKIWNVYRSRLIGQMMQDVGIKVIPTLSWAEPDTFTFCFDGLEKGGAVAVSTVGIMRDQEARKIWAAGMDAAMERLEPQTVLCYGSRIDYDFGGADVRYYAARKFGE